MGNLEDSSITPVHEVTFDGSDGGAVDAMFGFESTLRPVDLAPEPPRAISAGMQISDYRIEERIGEGAMGTVYRAVHPTIGNRVAIKVISPRVFESPEAVRRFVAEARIVAAIRHPNIIHVFGFGQLADGRSYLTMEWLDGTSLAARLKAGPIPLDESLHILSQLARALEAVHLKDVVHRDLKPENVFVQPVDDDLPLVKLLDFGIAKTFGEGSVTGSGQMIGTPIYMSPEQCRAKGVDTRADIYALGCVAMELLTGRPPFEYDNVAELIVAQLQEVPPRARTRKPSLPAELDSLIHRMLAKEPDDRPALSDVRLEMQRQIRRSQRSEQAAAAPVDAPAPTKGAKGAKADEPPSRPSFSGLDEKTTPRGNLELDDTAIAMASPSLVGIEPIAPKRAPVLIAPAEPVPVPAPVTPTPPARARPLVLGLVLAIIAVVAATIIVYVAG
jgi:serine/threonine protein kinase